MLKQTLLAAFAVATCSAFAQGGMMDVDAKTSKPGELMDFINKDAYKKLNGPDAYILTSFISGLPGNYQTAILRGLVANSQAAWTQKQSNQSSANSMAPMGDAAPMMWDWSNSEVKPPRSYWDTIKWLQKDQDATDQGLILTLFKMRPFTEDFLMSPCNERALDAITKYFAANAYWTEPTRLKYTSLAPRTYVSPTIPR